MKQTTLLEREDVLTNLDGDIELLRLLAATFVADAPRLLHEMKSAIRNGSADAAARACHNTKGSAANFGASELVTELKSMETLCRAGALHEASAILIRVEDAMHRLVAELHDLMAPPRG